MKLKINKIIQTLFTILVLSLPFNFFYIFNFSATQDFLFFKESLRYSLYFFDIIFITILIFWFIEKFKLNDFKPLLKSNWALPLLILYLLATSLFVSKNSLSALYSSVRLLEVLFFFIVFIDKFKTKKSLSRIIYSVFLTGVIQSLIGLFQFIFQKSLGLKYLGESVLSPQTLGVAKLEIHGEKFIRAYGTFPHPNLFGAFLFLALISGTYLISKRKLSSPFKLKLFSKLIKLKNSQRKLASKTHFGLGMLFISIGILVSFSRSIWLITAFLLLFLIINKFFFILKNNKYGFKSVFKYIFTFLLFFIVIISLFQGFIFSRLCLGNCQDQSASLRKNYLEYSLEIINKKPLTGIGIGQFTSNLKENNPKNLPDWHIQPVHNLYLLAWSEIGLIGLILLIIFIISKLSFSKNRTSGTPGVKLLEKIPKKQSFFLIGLTGFLILGLFDHYFWTLPQGQFIFWLSLALFTSSSRINE